MLGRYRWRCQLEMLTTLPGVFWGACRFGFAWQYRRLWLPLVRFSMNPRNFVEVSSCARSR